MEDRELDALNDIAQKLDSLSEEQRRNVLVYINSRFGGTLQTGRRLPVAANQEATVGIGDSDNMGEFFDSADPQTESEKVLVASYWVQVAEGNDDFEAAKVNKHLKNLGHPVSNVTRAFDTMMRQSPRMVIQTSKSGAAKQARKRYKVTREGIKRVNTMLSTTGATDDGE